MFCYNGSGDGFYEGVEWLFDVCLTWFPFVSMFFSILQDFCCRVRKSIEIKETAMRWVKIYLSNNVKGDLQKSKQILIRYMLTGLFQKVFT